MKAITINGVEILVEEAEKYIQINDICEKKLTEIWEYLTKHYSGFEAAFCFHDTSAPIEALTAMGADIIDDCRKLELTAQGFIPYLLNEITLLTKADFNDFAAYHDKINPDMYWTSRRIWEKRDIWRIFVIREGGELSGYAMLMFTMQNGGMAEVFCVEADNLSYRKALLSAAALCAFDNGKDTVVYMADNDSIHAQEAALTVGFKAVGHYYGYRAKPVKRTVPLTRTLTRTTTCQGNHPPVNIR